MFHRLFISGILLLGYLTLDGQVPMDKDSVESYVKPVCQGYVRSSFYGGGKQYPYAMLFAEAGLRPGFTSGSALVVSDIRLRAGSAFGNAFTKAEVKEFYGGFKTLKADVLFGSQIIAWGRCDGFNPTGNISPRDYFFLSAEPDDQLLPILAGRLKFRISDQVEVDAVASPKYKPSVYRFDLFDLGTGVSFADPHWPSLELRNGSLALRINADLPRAGFSLSWFNGFDPQFGFDLQNVQWKGEMPEITYVCTPFRKNTAGADFALSAGSWIIKGESGLNLIRHPGSSASVPMNNVQYVAGLERELAGFHTIVQYIGQYVFDFSELREPVPGSMTDPMALMKYYGDLILYNTLLFNRRIFRQEEVTNHALSLSISRSFGYEAWKSDLSAFYNFTSEEYVLRGSLAWSVTDALSLKTGCFLSGGPDESLINYAGPVLNGGFLELKVTF